MLTERDHKTQSPQHPDDDEREECHWHLAATMSCSLGTVVSSTHSPSNCAVAAVVAETKKWLAQGNLGGPKHFTCLSNLQTLQHHLHIFFVSLVLIHIPYLLLLLYYVSPYLSVSCGGRLLSKVPPATSSLTMILQASTFFS